MCAPAKKSHFNLYLLLGLALGLVTGFAQVGPLMSVADAVGTIVINLLKLISLPMIFLSVVSTISNMRGFQEVRTIGRRVLLYAVGTTAVSALVGLMLYKIINPVSSAPIIEGGVIEGGGSYMGVLLNIFPSNFVGVFLENHVIGVMLIALTFGLAILSLEDGQRNQLSSFFGALFSALLKVTRWLVYLMPIGVWAFVTIFVEQVRNENPDQLRSFFLYLAVVLGANVVMGLVILPIFAKWKGLSPWKLAKGTINALTMGFFTRSSGATLPLTLESCQDNLGISKRVSNFSIPLCATINMNGCASFILVTVLYVGTVNGMVFTLGDCFLWVGIATLAAVGNAGVAMGCYFLSSALLAAMNVPLTLLGMILPIYTFIDMVETALNIWSDVVVTAVVDKEVGQEEALAELESA